MLADVLLGGLLVTALVFDLRTRRIPNGLTLSAAAGGIFYHTLTGGLSGTLFSLQGLAVGLALLSIPFILGGLGGGDVKLLGAVGALKGTGFIVTAVLCTAVWGGLVALVAILLTKRFEILGRFGADLKMALLTAGRFGVGKPTPPAQALDKRLFVPYGVAIFLGTFSAYFVNLPLISR